MCTGTWSDVVGANSSSTCIKCGLGKFSVTDGASLESTCVNCGKGLYGNETGLGSELQCRRCPMVSWFNLLQEFLCVQYSDTSMHRRGHSWTRRATTTCRTASSAPPAPSPTPWAPRSGRRASRARPVPTPTSTARTRARSARPASRPQACLRIPTRSRECGAG